MKTFSNTEEVSTFIADPKTNLPICIQVVTVNGPFIDLLTLEIGPNYATTIKAVALAVAFDIKLGVL